MSCIAFLSDIHANIEALEAVLADLESVKVDEIFCLGDIVGYGAAPSECLELVRSRCSVSVMGNHLILTGNEKEQQPHKHHCSLSEP